MKPFNLTEALAGKKVVNAQGIVVTDIMRFDVESKICIAGIIKTHPHVPSYVGIWEEKNLFMAPTKKVGWIGLYAMSGLSMGRIGHTSGGIYETEEGARFSCKSASLFAKIEWEE